MKIGILSQWYPPEPGSASVPGVLATALAERGHDVSVVTGFPNYPTGQVAPGYRIRRRLDERLGAVSVRRVALYPSHDRSPLRRSLNYVSFALSATVSATQILRQVDALWVYNSPATVALPSALASARGGPPHLMHVMDLWPDSILYSGLSGERAYRAMEVLLARWCRWAYRQARGVATISRGILAALAERGVEPAKLHYVPLWADETQYQPRPADAALRSQLGLGERFTLLYAGNLGDTQGLDGLLSVAARCRDLDLQVVLAGSGTAEGRLRARAAELRLDNVTFLGRWPAADMGRLLSVADAALVSLRDDPLTALTMPSKLPAILASGRPVVAWASGEVARTVEAARCGFVAAPGDRPGLEAVLRQACAVGESGLRQLGDAARRCYREEFSLDRAVERVERLLAGMAGTAVGA